MSPSQNKAVIPQWQASSLTQAENCKIHNIKSRIFSYYRKQFSSEPLSAKQVSQLVPVNLVAEEILVDSILSAGSSVIKVTHSNGFSLEIPPSTELSSFI